MVDLVAAVGAVGGEGLDQLNARGLRTRARRRRPRVTGQAGRGLRAVGLLRNPPLHRGTDFVRPRLAGGPALRVCPGSPPQAAASARRPSLEKSKSKGFKSRFLVARQKKVPGTRAKIERPAGRNTRVKAFLDQLVPAGSAGPVKSVLVGRFRAESSPGVGQCGYGTSGGARGGRKTTGELYAPAESRA